jgi:hypothetical protein
LGHLLQSINPEAAEAIRETPAAPRVPDVGEIVIYHMRPGERRQGRTRFPALVQGEGQRGSLNLTVILEAGELRNETLVSPIGPGAEHHCWERPDDSHLAEAFRNVVASLHQRIGDLEGENKSMRALILGEYDAPTVSIIHIMQDFENRLRSLKQEMAGAGKRKKG